MPEHRHTEPLYERMRPLALFNGLQDSELRELAAGLRPARWAPRAQVMPATDTSESFYILLNGRVRIDAEHPHSGRAVTLFLLGPGDGHNLITLLDGQPHRVLAETLDETHAAYAPLARWHDWMRRYPPLRRTLLHSAATRLRELTDLAEDLALHETSARLAHLLLRHIDAEQQPHDLLQGLVHDDLARLIGSVRVVVNRLLNRFKHEGIISTDAGHIRVTDLEGLLRKAERRLRHRE